MPEKPKKRQTNDRSALHDEKSGEEKTRGDYYYDDAHGYEVYREEQTPSEIFTIGHSTRTLEEFIDLLQKNEIELLIDVRSFPGSRKFPQFNKESLEKTLPAAGVEYQHVKELGGRRPVQKGSQNTVWRNKAFQGYADYMETEDFRNGMERLIELAKLNRTAIMCSEAVWWRCHRSMISDHLKAGGIEVLHIMDGAKLVEHPFTSAARILNGELTYGLF